MTEDKLPEPWLRGTLTEVPAVIRAVLHALELAREDVDRACTGLTEDELNAQPLGLPPIGFHLRHLARSMDRLLTYAEGRPLTEEQLSKLNAELDPASKKSELISELQAAWNVSAARIREFGISSLETVRGVGRRQLPTTVGGLLIHVADHTQRHAGQVVTTAKVLLTQRSGRNSQRSGDSHGPTQVS